MRWPWVSRALYDSAIHVSGEYMMLLHHANARADAAEAKNDRLIDQMLSMKKEGFQVVHPPVQREPQPVRAADAAIEDRAGRNSALRRHLIDFANSERRKGVGESEIAERISTWHGADEGEE